MYINCIFIFFFPFPQSTLLDQSVLIIFKGPSRLSEPGPKLQQMMDSGKSSSLNASIRERLRSKVRGKQVFLKHHMQYYWYGHGKGETLSTANLHRFPISAKLHLNDA